MCQEADLGLTLMCPSAAGIVTGVRGAEEAFGELLKGV